MNRHQQIDDRVNVVREAPFVLVSMSGAVRITMIYS